MLVLVSTVATLFTYGRLYLTGFQFGHSGISASAVASIVGGALTWPPASSLHWEIERDLQETWKTLPPAIGHLQSTARHLPPAIGHQLSGCGLVGLSSPTVGPYSAASVSDQHQILYWKIRKHAIFPYLITSLMYFADVTVVKFKIFVVDVICFKRRGDPKISIPSLKRCTGEARLIMLSWIV